MTPRVKRPRGTGSYWKRPRGGWAIGYSKDGTEHRESVATMLGKPPSTVTEEDARRALARRLKELATGTYIGPKNERLTVSQILADYYRHVELKSIKSVSTIKQNGRRISADLGEVRASDVGNATIERWTKQELAARTPYAPATINLSISCLKSALRHAQKNGVLVSVPPLTLLRVRNTRQGFFEAQEFRAVAAKLEEPYADIARFGYVTGARIREALGLRWEHVDRHGGSLTFQDTKNGESRTIPLEEELAELVERRWHARRTGDRLAEHVFHHRGGLKISYTAFWLRWRRAAATAGLAGKLFHDLRRTAIRNLVRAGAPETVAMTISGHRSRAVFDRYNISSDTDRRAALKAVSAYHQAVTAAISNVVEMGWEANHG
jgi:integrase